MKANQTILSALFTTALALPCIASASGVPGSSDEARRAAAARVALNPSAQIGAGHDDPTAVLRASATDEARALFARRQSDPAVAISSDCVSTGAATPRSTDEARASYGRLVAGAFEACARRV